MRRSEALLSARGARPRRPPPRRSRCASSPRCPTSASLAEVVGGPEVEVTVLVKGPQDAHFIEPRPSFVRALHDADLFVLIGMELEIGWVPPLLQSARNPEILPGGSGYLDASRGDRAASRCRRARVDRSMGDVHPQRQPALPDRPGERARVAALLRDRLAAAAARGRRRLRAALRDFAAELALRLVGPQGAAGRDPEEIVRAVEAGRSPTAPLGGWLGALRGARGRDAPWRTTALGVLRAALRPRDGRDARAEARARADHARTSPRWSRRMKRDGVGLILSSVYFDPRHARCVAERSGARVVPAGAPGRRARGHRRLPVDRRLQRARPRRRPSRA